MNIGIDIDGVLTDVGKFIIEEGLKYCSENNKGKLVDIDGYDTINIFDWDKETDNDFWVKNIFLYAENYPVIDGASENIKKLKEEGHNIYIITARWLTDGKNSEFFEGDVAEKMRNTVKRMACKKQDYI